MQISINFIDAATLFGEIKLKRIKLADAEKIKLTSHQN